MKHKIVTFLFAFAASIGNINAAITVRLDSKSCSDWSKVYLWAWNSNGNLFDAWPGIAVDKDEKGWYSYTFAEDIKDVDIIWNNGAGAQTVDIIYIEESTCYALNSSSGKDITVKVVDCPGVFTVQVGELYYKIFSEKGTAEVSLQNDQITTANIPASITYDGVNYSVTSIVPEAFYKCSKLTSVTIPNSVIYIGWSAFKGCSSLTHIEIPSSITSIDSYLFYGCSSLSYVEIPNSVTSIGWSAFEGCSSLKDIEIPNSITEISAYLFYGCSSLTNIEIPNSIKSIGDSVFCNCSNLATIICDVLTPPSLGEGVFHNVNNSIPLYVPKKKLDTYKSTEKWKDFKNIQPIPEPAYGEYKIGDLYYILYAVDTTATVTSQRNSTTLTTVNIPASVIYNGTRYRVTSIGGGAFENCTGLTSVTIPYSVTEIGNGAFNNCSNLTLVTINGNQITSIGKKTFYNCSKLTSITLGNKVTSIGESAFDGCADLTSITIPNSVKSIGGYAFQGCTSLKSVTIPNSVTEISWRAFYGCTGLKSLMLPNSVTSIGDGAFYNCSGLTTITCSAVTPPELGAEVFYNVNKSIPLYVPGSSTYKTVEQWKDFKNIRPIKAASTDVFEIQAEPTDNGVVIKWPAAADATTYYIEIKKNEEQVCFLAFDEQGNLLTISYAKPARNGNDGNSYPHMATQTATGWQFNVSGLESNTTYTYTVTAKKSYTTIVVYQKSGTFATGDTTTTIDAVVGSNKQSVKVMWDGQLYILRDGKTYTVQGQEVK